MIFLLYWVYSYTYIKLRVDNVYKAAQNDNKIKYVPGVTEVILQQDENCKNNSKLQVSYQGGALQVPTLKRKAASLNTNSRANTAVKIMLSLSNASVYASGCL